MRRGLCHDVTTKLPSGLTSKSASRSAPAGRGVRSVGEVSSPSTRQMRGAGAEIPVPVPDRIAGVQYRGDLVVLAQVPQPVVVVDVQRRRQQRRAYHRLGVSRAVLTASTPPGGARPRPPRRRRRQIPRGRGRLVVVVGRAHRDVQQVTVGRERRRRLALRPSGQASGRQPAFGSSSQIAVTYSVRFSLGSLTVVTTRAPSGETASPDTRGRAKSRRDRRTGFRSCDVRSTAVVSLIFKLTHGTLTP